MPTTQQNHVVKLQLSDPCMFVLQWLMGITIWVANTITGRLRRPLPSSPCTASGIAVRQASLLWKSVKKGKLGSVSLNLAQNWSSVFPNSTPWSSKLCPPKNMCPPLDKLHRAQSEGFRTGYFTWRAGFFVKYATKSQHCLP